MHLPVTSDCPQKANPSITKKHHHPPRFTVPEPVELGIEPILPIRCLTSPSPSPPPVPKPSYLMNFRSMIGQSSHQLLDNYSNIFDESGDKFLGEGMTTINERSTAEQSINFNHLTHMGILGSGGQVCGAGIKPRKLQSVSNCIDKSWRETTDGLDDQAINLKQRLEAMRETEDDGSVDVNGLVEQMERARAICNKRPLDKLEEILVESILEKVEAKRKKNNMLATTSTTSVVAKDQTQKICLQLEGNSKLKKISIEKTVARTDGNIRNQLNQDQSEGNVDKMRTVKTLDSRTAPLTSWVTFEKPSSLPPPSSLLRPRKTMPNLCSLETPTNLSLATAKKTKKRLLAPLSLNSNASRPPLFDTLIKKPRFMATATTISTTDKIPSSRRSDAMLLSKPAGLGAKKTKLKPSTKDCGKNGSPRVLKTQSSISSKLINPSIGSGINSRLAKRESLLDALSSVGKSFSLESRADCHRAIRKQVLYVMYRNSAPIPTAHLAQLVRASVLKAEVPGSIPGPQYHTLSRVVPVPEHLSRREPLLMLRRGDQ
ncbi:hypothetical protein BY996DRAFT_6437578 [Phakopsora pachyrhizi]|nr:hypothetical protein BY996DRAFT_6437578 [Phakopsora pachyrhizi]